MNIIRPTCLAMPGCAALLAISLITATVAPALAQAPAKTPDRRVAQQPAEPSVAVPEQANITTEVYFDLGSAKLTAGAKAVLDTWLQSTQGVKPDFILSIGHTDRGEGGNEAKAVKLSETRAEAVRAYLATKGIDPTQVYVEGKGDTQPVAATNAPTERAKNRRVDVGMIGKRD